MPFSPGVSSVPGFATASTLAAEEKIEDEIRACRVGDAVETGVAAKTTGHTVPDEYENGDDEEKKKSGMRIRAKSRTRTIGLLSCSVIEKKWRPSLWLWKREWTF